MAFKQQLEPLTTTITAHTRCIRTHAPRSATVASVGHRTCELLLMPFNVATTADVQWPSTEFEQCNNRLRRVTD